MQFVSIIEIIYIHFLFTYLKNSYWDGKISEPGENDRYGS